MTWNRIIYHNHQLRPGWKIALWAALSVLIFILGLFSVAGVLALAGWRVDGFTTLNITITLQALAVLTTTLLLDGDRIRSIFVPVRWRLCGIGLLFGLVSIDGMVLLMKQTGLLQGSGYARFAWEYLPLLGLVAVYEEIAFRGFVLGTLEKATKWPVAACVSSLLFGLVHLINQGATLPAVIGITGAGLLMAFAYRRSGSLWLPIGLHFGWNVCEGLIFGFPTSGVPMQALVTLQLHGPAWLTGGAFGPEGGLMLLAALGIGGLLVWGYTHAPGDVPAAVGEDADESSYIMEPPQDIGLGRR